VTYGTSPPCGLPSVRSFSSPGQQTRRSSRRTIGYTRILSQVSAERRAVPHADERVLGQPIEAQFGPLRTCVMSNSDYRNHPALARKLQAYLRWCNAQGSLPRHAGRPAPRARPHPQRTPATLGPPQTQGCLTNPVNVRGQRTRSRVSAASRRITLVLARMWQGRPGTARIVIPCLQNHARTVGDSRSPGVGPRAHLAGIGPCLVPLWSALVVSALTDSRGVASNGHRRDHRWRRPGRPDAGR
jgi:hypothetical protein